MSTAMTDCDSPVTEITPEEGWRLLRDDEVIRDGDKAIETRTTHNRWYSLSTSVWYGRTVGSVRRDHEAAGLYLSRRIETPAVTAEPGWRILGPDEVVELDDQFDYESNSNKTWPRVGRSCSFLAGHTPKHHREGCHPRIVFRRRVVEEFPVGVRVRVKPDLNEGPSNNKAGYYGVVSEKHGSHDQGWRAVTLDGGEYLYGFQISELEPDTRPEIEEGYRYLQHNEKVEEGDEYLCPVREGWGPSWNWEGGGEQAPNWLYRRPLPKPEPTVDPAPPIPPPDGFQVMPADYKSQPGDLFLGRHWVCWQEAHWTGKSRDDLNAEYSTKNWEYWIASPIPKPVTAKTPDAGPGYRPLHVGERIQEGDEFYLAYNGKWLPTGDAGCNHYKDDPPRRRKMPTNPLTEDQIKRLKGIRDLVNNLLEGVA